MRQSMCVIVIPTTLGAGTHKLDRYPFRKMRKSQEQYQSNSTSFSINFFSMMDLKIFMQRGMCMGAGMGR